MHVQVSLEYIPDGTRSLKLCWGMNFRVEDTLSKQQ